MTGRHRLRVIALGGLIALCASQAPAQPSPIESVPSDHPEAAEGESVDNGADANGSGEQPDPHSEEAQSGDALAQSGVPTPDDGASSEPDTPEDQREASTDPDNLDHRDVEAQERMSLYALLTAIFTGVGVLVGAGGSWLVWKTYRTAQADLRNSVDSSKRQLRAYVSVRKVEITGGGSSGTAISVTFRSGGATPAYGVVAKVTCERMHTDNTFTVCDERTVNFGDVGIGQKRVIETIATGKFSLPIDIQSKETLPPIIVRGVIKYRDAFEHDRWTEYRFSTPAAWRGERPTFWATPDGNKSN